MTRLVAAVPAQARSPLRLSHCCGRIVCKFDDVLNSTHRYFVKKKTHYYLHGRHYSFFGVRVSPLPPPAHDERAQRSSSQKLNEQRRQRRRKKKRETTIPREGGWPSPLPPLPAAAVVHVSAFVHTAARERRARSCWTSRPLPEQLLPDAETGAAAARGQQHSASLPAAVIRAVAGAARYNMAAG